MHTHTHTAAGHRWFVAAPLFLLFLGLSIREGITPSFHADVTESIDASSDHQTFTVGRTVYRLEAKTNFRLHTSPTLEAGTVLVYSDVLSHVHVGTMDIEGWNGGFQVTKTEKSITIAALSTPVFVRQDNHEMIVPAFMQWKGDVLVSEKDGMDAWAQSREVYSLPETFSADRLHDLDALAALVPPADVSEATPLLPPLLGQELRLQSARDRTERLERIERVQEVQRALASHAEAIDSLLLAPDMPAILSSPEGQDALPLLLSTAVTEGKGDLFLPFFIVRPDCMLLASFHPLIRDHTRVLPESGDITDDERLTLLFLTPFSDVAPQEIAGIALSQWQAQWLQQVKTQVGVQQFIASLPFFQKQIGRLDALQYPKRVDTYVSALLVIAEPLDISLTPEAKQILGDLRTLRDARRLAAPLADVSSSSSSSFSSFSSSSTVSHSSISPSVLVKQTETQLQQAGFMVIGDTRFEPVNSLVQVSHIVFGAPKGDMLLQFTFDPLTATVSGIEQNGQLLPYDVPLSGFLEWLRH